MSKFSGLGKGLGALLPNTQPLTKEKVLKESVDHAVEKRFENKESSILKIPIDKIRPNPFQPRQSFDSDAIAELAASIKEHGVIQPITVHRTNGDYELIAGERRLRASQVAGLTEIPAYIMDVKSDEAMIEMALIENVQREDLDPIEVAMAYQLLIETCKLTQEDVAKKVGKDRATVSNFMRLLRLPEEIQEALRAKQITVGQARPLLGLSNPEKQKLAARHIIENGYSARSAEGLVKDYEADKIEIIIEDDKTKIIKPNGPQAPSKPKTHLELDDETRAIISSLENRLREKFATQVKIAPKTKDSGIIEIEYFNADEFNRLLEVIGVESL